MNARKSLVVDRLFVRRIIRRFCWPKNVWLSWESWEESRTNYGEGGSSLKEFACGLFEKSSDCCASSFLDSTSRLSREQRFQTFVPATRIWNKIGYLYTNEFLTANKFRLVACFARVCFNFTKFRRLISFILVGSVNLKNRFDRVSFDIKSWQSLIET